MEENCCVMGCSMPVTSTCDCNLDILYFCQYHSATHILENRNKRHSVISLEQIFEVKDQVKFQTYFQDLLIKTNLLKCQFLKLVQEINLESERIFKSINTVCNWLKSAIKDIQLTGSIKIIVNKNSKVDMDHLDNDKVFELEKFLFSFKKKEYKYFEFEKDSVSLRYLDLNQRNIINSKMINESEKCSDDTLYILKGTDKILFSLNLDNFSVKKTHLSLLPEKIYGPCTYQISKDYFFIYGGRRGLYPNEIYYSTTFLLNVTTMQFQKMPDGLEVSDTIPILLNSEIYIFGGKFNSKMINFSQKFNLNTNTWKNISNLPKSFMHSSSISLNRKHLLISGNLDKCLFIYHVNQDRFETIPTNIKVEAANLLIEMNGVFFIITEKIYETTDVNFTNWEIVNEMGILNFSLKTAGIIRNDYLYFADWKLNIYIGLIVFVKM